jgi:arylsulfatase A-like enzyme
VLLGYLEGEACSPSCSGTLDDNTLVIYVADNGLFIADHGMREKMSAYEEAIRVPLLIQYPGSISAGTTRSEIVNNGDIAPTILSYAGIAVPAEMQGRSLSEL